ncbi:MAG: DUF1573 domain-containing protein [Flavobacteriaceae bacterium]
MKKEKRSIPLLSALVLLTLFGILITSCIGNEQLTNNASLNFTKTIHDFDELPLKEEASFVFDFENNGKELLQITNVKTTCGCAVPSWPKEIIKPSGKGSIKVTYDSKFPGRFNKTITVYYNGENSPLELKIKGAVKYPEEK